MGIPMCDITDKWMLCDALQKASNIVNDNLVVYLSMLPFWLSDNTNVTEDSFLSLHLPCDFLTTYLRSCRLDYASDPCDTEQDKWYWTWVDVSRPATSAFLQTGKKQGYAERWHCSLQVAGLLCYGYDNTIIFYQVCFCVYQFGRPPFWCAARHHLCICWKRFTLEVFFEITHFRYNIANCTGNWK